MQDSLEGKGSDMHSDIDVDIDIDIDFFFLNTNTNNNEMRMSGGSLRVFAIMRRLLPYCGRQPKGKRKFLRQVHSRDSELRVKSEDSTINCITSL